MSIVNMRQILEHARRHHYAVGYFEAWDQYSLEGTLEAAEALQSPSIIGFGAAVTDQTWLNRGGVEVMSTLAHCLAQRANVPTAILFNEARTFAQIMRGLRGGCTAVMLDCSQLSYEANVEATRQVVAAAHAVGATVEAELGHLPNDQDPDEISTQTDPDSAVAFVAATGIDALAVSIGNVHMLTHGEACVDLALLERIHHAVPLPLVVHGGTGFPPGAVADAIRCGVTKFNVGTRLRKAFWEGMRAVSPDANRNIFSLIGSHEETDVLLQGQRRMEGEISELIHLYGSVGQASGW